MTNDINKLGQTNKKMKNKFVKTYKERLPNKIEKSIAVGLDSAFTNKKTWNPAMIK